MSIKYDKKQIAKLVGENPEYAIAHMTSDIFKVGSVDVKIPQMFIKMGGTITVKIPRKELIDEAKKGKLGSYQIQKPPENKLQEIPVLRSMFSSYLTINLIVDEGEVS